MIFKLGIAVGALAAAFVWIDDNVGGFVSAQRSKFTPEAMPDLGGKVAVVTGGNTGIGYVTAMELALKGAHVIFTVRSHEKGRDTLDRMTAEMKERGLGAPGKLEYGVMDLGSLASVRDFANNFLIRKLPLHMLIQNAGVMAPDYTETTDGFELQFGVNHLGHFYLFQLFEGVLRSSAPARVAVVSSIAMWFPTKGGIRFDALRSDDGYDPWPYYGQSKLANALFAIEAAKRLNGTQVSVNVLHPGAIATDLSRHVAARIPAWLNDPLQTLFNSLVLMTPAQGAWNQLYVATMPPIEDSGLYFRPVGIQAPPAALALDTDLQKKLWETSEALIAEAEKAFVAENPASAEA